MPTPPSLNGISGGTEVLQKKTDDPKPKQEKSNLRKIFINAIKGPTQDRTFWISKMVKLYQDEKKVKIDWDELAQNFEDVSKKEAEPKEVKETQAEEFENLLSPETSTRLEIQLSKFKLGVEEVKKGLKDMKLGFDQITQISNLLPNQEVGPCLTFRKRRN